MRIDKVNAYNNELYRHTEIRRAEQHHSEKIQEERRIKQRHEVEEAKRIEANRRMNRPGQNIDRMA
jgi:hypothetical protein